MQFVHQFGEAQAVFAGGGIDADGPEFLEIAFFEFAVAVGVGIGMEQSFLGGYSIGATAVGEPFGAGKYVLAAFMGGNASFDSGHDCLLNCFENSAVDFGNYEIASLVFCRIATFAGVEMGLAGLASHQFAGTRDAERFGHSFVGLVHITWLAVGPGLMIRFRPYVTGRIL